MNPRRFLTVLRMEYRREIWRPLMGVLLALVLLMSYFSTSGNLTVQSGDESVGGKRAHLTSEHNVAFLLTVFVATLYAFFGAVAAGRAVQQDRELNVEPLLQATPLRAGEYIVGRFLAVLAALLTVLTLHIAAMLFCHHVLPNTDPLVVGPFRLANYLRPALLLGVPTILFVAGTTFLVGTLSRNPIVVYLVPVALLIAQLFFLWSWSPAWLDWRTNQILMALDPSAFRWLIEQRKLGDRGVDFYNAEPIAFDAVFAINRSAFTVLGLLSVGLAYVVYARGLRGAGGSTKPARVRAVPTVALTTPLGLKGAARPLGFLGGLWQMARFELRELAHQPGLYLFAPLIVLEAWGVSTVAIGAFDTPLLNTPGTLAVGMMNALTLMMTLLLLFYSVEAVERERTTGLGPIVFATPVRSGALLAGKALALAVVGAVVLTAAFLAAWLVLVTQRFGDEEAAAARVAMSPAPFALVWGLLLLPTFFVWASFVFLLHALFRNRYAVFAVALAVLALTGYLQYTDRMTWVGNWWIWGAVRWSDLGPLELDGKALFLNRLFVLALAVAFLALALRRHYRREYDAAGTLARLRPAPLAWSALRLSPFLVLPLIAGVALWAQVRSGWGGADVQRRQKDYWKGNLATWKDAPKPDLTEVILSVDLDPPNRHLAVEGTYRLVNRRDEPLKAFALTGNTWWEGLTWTLDGEPYTPKETSCLHVVTPPKPLKKGESVVVGFRFSGTMLKGLSKDGSGASEFVLPSGAILTSFSPSMAPVLGYVEGVGSDKENTYESRKYPEDYHLGEVEALFGSASFTTRVTLSGPADYVYNSVGVVEREEEKDGRRTVVWVSDRPVRFFNVAAGRWVRREGPGVAVYHHPDHGYNIPEIVDTLAAARKYYSEWFGPYPWQELKLNEFANHASYAQGFPTNITFSEGIGFLTRQDVRGNAAALVTAHEAAHQWWGNMVTPGKGPGGNVISEGLSHFSAILLLEQTKGVRERIEACKAIEASYTSKRRLDAELPLTRLMGDKGGDTAVTYDKGGWAFWMLLNHLGRERMLAGLRAFVVKYGENRDHPLLEDLLAVLRPHALDAEAFDRFARLWFFDVVLPRYEIVEATRSEEGGRFRTTVRLKNAGTGAMPVQVAVTAGERFAEKGDYRDDRQTTTLGTGEEVELTFETPFAPERVVVDPDALVLQMGRKKATTKLE